MKIKLTSVYVDDQDKALRFYTEVLGLTRKTDVSNGGVSLADRGVGAKTRTDPSCSSRSTTTRRPRPTSKPCSRRDSPRSCSTPTTSRASTSA